MPFYQMCIRKDATASNGTEGAYASDDWVILTRSPYTQEISSDKTYTVTIIVYNGRAYQYINGTPAPRLRIEPGPAKRHSCPPGRKVLS